MEIKTSELTGSALDLIVDRLEGGCAPTNPDHLRIYLESLNEDKLWNELCKYTPGDIDATGLLSDADMIEYGIKTWRCPPVSTDWAFGGPIIQREEINLSINTFHRTYWEAWTPAPEQEHGEAVALGPTPLIAAMRCYVASKLGDTVDIPEELT